jgi:type II secretory pathway pseudopilin PulG
MKVGANSLRERGRKACKPHAARPSCRIGVGESTVTLPKRLTERTLKRSEGRAPQKPDLCGHGFTLVELLVIVGVVVLLFLMAIPAGDKNRGKADRIKCINNMKNVGLAFRIFATDNGDLYPMSLSMNRGGSLDFTNAIEVFRHFQAMSNELATPKILRCPNDTRTEATNWSSLRNQTISYFVGLDSNGTRPQSLLSGDRNLTTNGVPLKSGIHHLTTNSVVGWSRELHDGQGSIVLGDGSVQPVSPQRLQDQVRTADMAPIRLAVP